MHQVIIRTTEARCSCDESHITSTGGDAQRWAYIHARKNSPSIVQDRRLCSEDCIAGVRHGAPIAWHHPNCFHTTESNEDINV